ncbi:hypothetical protein D9758_011801 [Tetrapyrgos nigripes]|uniref:DUF6534 domain-containing protein n=1 Tax=Tetrapyrgos nigripes TaxID=182062 RepID=A0A8H5CY88_9AGAR|nr:hypothetical protein D9758_011801 [Tetrapyrgos nigripes]
MGDTTQCPAISADIALITGPTMLGICLNWGLMGVLVVQTYFYHISFPNDSKLIKSLVYGLFVLDILQTALVTADAFHWFVFGFGNLDQLDDTFLNSWDVPMLDAVISLIVQCFYSWRIYVLTSSWILPGIIVLVSMTQCGAGIATAVQAHKLGKLHLISTEVVEQTTWLVGSAVADILITIVMTWTLLRSRSKELTISHGFIDRIVILTVETNGATTLTAIVSLILFLGVPQHATLVVPPTAIIGKLYTNCLVAVFNNRRIPSLRSANTGHAGSSGSAFGVTSPRSNPQMNIQVVRNANFSHDEDLELNYIAASSQDKGPSNIYMNASSTPIAF